MIRHFHLKLNDEKSIDKRFIDLLDNSKNKVSSLRFLYFFWDTFRDMVGDGHIINMMIEEGGVQNGKESVY